jgi:hypothetical protein
MTSQRKSFSFLKSELMGQQLGAPPLTAITGAEFGGAEYGSLLTHRRCIFSITCKPISLTALTA